MALKHRLLGADMARKSNTRWTAEDDARLLALRAAGKPYLTIAVALRRSAASVTARAKILKTRSGQADKETAS